MGTCFSAADTVKVTVTTCSPLIHVPNSFTPDGDGLNDIFQPVINGDLAGYELDVFDRWGELIFRTQAVGEGWDGKVGGTSVQDGVYAWTIHYKAFGADGVEQERLFGHVTLVR
jgi:gliding motility-associated-like protein